jgi:hypothetical protein
MSTVLLTFLSDSFSRRCVVLDQLNAPCVSDVTFRVSDSCNFMNWQHTDWLNGRTARTLQTQISPS